MKILCLPGAFANADSYAVQLAPLVNELTSDGSCDFYFTQGSVTCRPPTGFEDYFGPGPHYRFIDYDGLSEGMDAIEKIRDFPEGTNSEDIMRRIFPEGQEDLVASISRAFVELYELMETHGPFDGIIGYSEGATVASSLLLDEAKRKESEGRDRMLKCGIFFSGWPPISVSDGGIVLAGDNETLIDIPTCHVVGAADPYLHGSLALYNVCDEDNAVFFDHGKGHTLPRDQQTIKELANVIRSMIDETTSSGTATPESMND